MPDDAYSQFLGLPDGPRPPKAHVLLGVEPDVNDPEIIEAAVQRRMDQLDKYALSNDRAMREQVQRLMNEVAKARVKLVNQAEQRAKKAAKAAETRAKKDAQAAAIKTKPAPVTPVSKPTHKQTPKPSPAVAVERPDAPSKPPFKFTFTWPKLSAEAWSLLGVAWLMSIVVTATGAYFVASQIKPEPAPAPATGPLASSPPADPTSGPDNTTPTTEPEPTPLDDPPVVERPDPEPEPEPEPAPETKPGVIADFEKVFADLDTLSPPVAFARVMDIDDVDQRFLTYLRVRDHFVGQPKKQVQLVVLALKAFNNTQSFEHTAGTLDGKASLAIGPTKRNTSDRSRLEITDLSAIQGMTFATLELRQQDGIKDFSALSTIRAETLVLDNCDHFKEIGLISKVVNLRSLTLDATAVSDLRPLNWRELYQLSLQGCQQLKSLEGLEGKRIDVLTLNGSANITDFSALRSMRIAKRLDLSGTKFADLSLLTNQPLSELVLDGCPKLDSLNGLEWLPQLQLLSLQETVVLPHEVVRFVGSLPNVVIQESYHQSIIPLDVKKWEGLADIEDEDVRHISFVKLRDNHTPFSKAQIDLIRKELKYLNRTEVELRMWKHQADDLKITVGTSGRNRGVTDLSPLAGMTVDSVWLRYLPELKDFSFLEGSTITRLDLTGCSEFSDISIVNEIDGLEELVLNQTGVSDLRPLRIKTLKKLSLDNCKNLSSLDGLDGMTINRLSAVSSTALWHINALQSVRGVTYLNLSQTGIKQIVPLLAQRDLQYLYLSSCKALQSIELLGKLSKLKTLVADGLNEVPSDEFAKLKRDLPNTQIIETQSNGVAQNNAPDTPVVPKPKDPEADLLPPLSFDKIKMIKNKQARLYEFLKLRDSMEPYSRQQAALIRDAIIAFNGAKGLPIRITTNGKDAFTLVNAERRKNDPRSPLRSVTDLSMLKDLSFQTLDLGGCSWLIDFSVLSTMQIKELKLHHCRRVNDFKAFNSIEGLELLDVSDTMITSLETYGIEKLDTLVISELRRIRSLKGLENKDIRFLQAEGLTSLLDITALQTVDGLEWLDLSGTPIDETRSLSGLALKQLDLRGCNRLNELTGLLGMRTLKKLDLTGVTGITDSYAKAIAARIDGLEVTR